MLPLEQRSAAPVRIESRRGYVGDGEGGVCTLRKSPPWIMKSLMTRWKTAFLYPTGMPCFLYSPVQNCLHSHANPTHPACRSARHATQDHHCRR